MSRRPALPSTEETGWLTRIDGLLGIYSDPSTQVHRYPSAMLEQLLGVVFLASAIEYVGVPDAETAEVRWVTASAVPTPLFGPNVLVLRDALDATEIRPIIR
jgi:8-oxo-dGTP diphosphatase